MIRRSLNERFADKVFAGIKTTTIRDKAWPVGVPIMLFRWSGKPYRSKQIDIAPVVVESTQRVHIDRIGHDPDRVGYSISSLWKSEGFNSRDDMDEWFRPLVKPGGMITKHLMRFRLLERRDG